MNKKLLAIAIAGVVAAPLAQAQTANVTLYGRLNLDAEVILQNKQDGVPAGCSSIGGTAAGSCAKQNIYRVSSNSSRLGVRGTESLGGGLNAIFQVESGFDASNSGGNLATRETFVGLQAGWGTLKVGYFLSPYDDIQSIFGSAPTLQTGILGSQSLWSNTGFVGNTTQLGSFDDRVANSIRYDSPNIAGFTGSVQIGARDTGGSDGGTLAEQRRHAYVVSTGGQYNNGPLAVGLTYEVHNNLRDGTTANPHLQDQAATVAASWNFGIVKVGAAYEYLNYNIGATGNGTGIGAGNQQAGDLKRNFWAISATANLGPGQLYAAYWWAGNGTGVNCPTALISGQNRSALCPRVGALTAGDNTGSQQWEISYTYPLSKRTLLYTGYTMIDNKSNASYNFGVNQIQGMCGGPASGSACGDAGRPQGIVAGMVHFF